MKTIENLNPKHLTHKAMIFDVIVEPRYRKQGLGKKLMDAILSHDKLQKVKHFELYCLPEIVAFYKDYRFEDDLERLVFMRRINPLQYL